MKNIRMLLKQLIAFILCFMIIPVFPALAEDSVVDTRLKELCLSGGASFEFDPDVFNYEVLLPYDHTEGITDTLRMPEVFYMPMNPTAKVEISEPAMAEEDTTAVITVSAEGGTDTVYTLNFVPIGVNLFPNPGFEEGLSLNPNVGNGVEQPVGWHAKNGGLTLSNENAAEGSSSVVVGCAAYNGLTLRENLPIDAETVYLYSSMYRKRKDTDTNLAFGIWESMTYYDDEQGKSVNLASGEYDIAYYNQKGSQIAKGWLLSDEWQRLYGTVSVTRTVDRFNWQYLASDGGILRYMCDEMFLGELTVNDVAIVDSLGEKVVSVEKLDDEDSTLEFSAVALNQLGTPAGLENETVSSWRLADSYEGVSLSDDGVLTVNPDASGSITVLCDIYPSYTGACQSKVTGIAEINILEPKPLEDVYLKDIHIGELALADFHPKKTDYIHYVPYNYTPGDFSQVEVPVVTCFTRDESVSVDVQSPEAVDGGVITVTVTSADGEREMVYTIALKAAGENLYEDGGFESEGTWIPSSILERTQENPAAGSYAMIVKRPNGGYYEAKTRPVTKPGITYLNHCMFRHVEGAQSHEPRHSYEGATGIGIKGVYYDGNGNEARTLKTTEEWQSAYSTFITTKASYAVKHNLTLWGPEDDLVLDEYYVGELVVSDLTYKGETTGVIPSVGDEDAEIRLNASCVNQFGNTIGLTKENFKYELIEKYPGVRVEDNRIIVTDKAVEGDFRLRIKLIPSFGSIQEAVAASVNISLVASADDSTMPYARNLDLQGTVAEGETLTGSYSYYQVKSIAEGASILRWYVSEIDGSNYREITDYQGSDTFYVKPEYANKRVYFEVTPVTVEGIQGASAVSTYLCPPQAPVAKNVAINGGGYIGAIIKGDYTYHDDNMDDIESNTVFRWSSSQYPDRDFEPIEGKTMKEYEVGEGDVNRYIRFEVKTASNNEPNGDIWYPSESMLCATTPTVSEVEISTISKNNYKVSYTYVHPLNVSEGETQIVWYLNDAPTAKGISATIEASSGATISVKVTPVASKEPSVGIAATAKYTISGSNKNSFVSASGSGKKGSGFVPLPVIQPVEPEQEEPVVIKHWAEDGINFVLSQGIMQNRSKDDFGNTELVTRADFVYYIIKALGETESSYDFEFEDVSGTDYYAGALQKAVDLGIISRDIRFNPMRNVSRQEISKILITAIGASADSEPSLDKFSDVAAISEWARGYVSASVSTGLLKGISETEFLPHGMVTREQTAVILKRLYDYKNGGEVQ